MNVGQLPEVEAGDMATKKREYISMLIIIYFHKYESKQDNERLIGIEICIYIPHYP